MKQEPKTEQPKWVLEFDDKASRLGLDGEQMDELRHFLRHLISKRDRELLEKVEGMIEEEPPHAGDTRVEAAVYSFAKGVNSVIKRVIDLINKR